MNGSTSTERWSSNTAFNIVGGASTLEATYYHQYSFVASYSIVGGGSPTAPSLSTNRYGISNNDPIVAQGQIVWLDVGSSWSITNPLGGGTSEERWQTNSLTSGSADGASSLSITYYHQYAMALSYSIVGGGTPEAPLVTGSQFGRQFSAMLVGQPTFYLDSGSQWAVQGVLTNGTPTAGSQSGERWATSQTASGVVSAGAKLAIVYHHQFYLSAVSGSASGGTVTNSTGWLDSGASVHLLATAAAGWKFEGWAGSGSGAYSGPLNQTTVHANGPISETATFYPGLVITAGDNGGVSYSFGSSSGTVAAGTSLTVYAPQGSLISLVANPSSIFYQFGTWSPASTSGSGRSTLTLASPAAVRASFSINPLTLGGGIAALVILVAAIAVFALRRKSKSRKPKESTPAWLEPLRKSRSGSP